MYPWFQNKDKEPEVAPFHPRPGMTKTKKSHMGICVIYVFHSQHDVYNLYLKYLFQDAKPLLFNPGGDEPAFLAGATCVSRYLNLEGQIGVMLWWNNWITTK